MTVQTASKTVLQIR